MDFFMKYKKYIIVLLVIALFVIPYIVQLLFWFGESEWGIPTTLNQSDILNYTCSFIAICATIYLGYVANRLNIRLADQNQQLIKQNQRIVQMEEKDRLPIIDLRLLEKCISPHINIIIITEEYRNPDNQTLCFECTNLSNIYICNITLDGYDLIYNGKQIKNSSISADVSANGALGPNEKKEMELILPLGIYSIPSQASFDFIITVVGGTPYKETISFDLVGMPGNNYTSNKLISVTPIQAEKV